jgi:hypothetical protein
MTNPFRFRPHGPPVPVNEDPNPVDPSQPGVGPFPRRRLRPIKLRPINLRPINLRRTADGPAGAKICLVTKRGRGWVPNLPLGGLRLESLTHNVR